MACSNYVKDMSVEGFNLILDNYIEDYFKHRICFECLKNDLTNYREIFQPILINFVSYSNRIISVSKFTKMTKEIIRNYNIIDIRSKEHIVRHREIIKAHRRLSRPRNPQIIFSANRRRNLSNNRNSNISISTDNLSTIRQRIGRPSNTETDQDIINVRVPYRNIELLSGDILDSNIEITNSQTLDIDSNVSYTDVLTLLSNIDESHANDINSTE